MPVLSIVILIAGAFGGMSFLALGVWLWRLEPKPELALGSTPGAEIAGPAGRATWTKAEAPAEAEPALEERTSFEPAPMLLEEEDDDVPATISRQEWPRNASEAFSDFGDEEVVLGAADDEDEDDEDDEDGASTMFFTKERTQILSDQLAEKVASMAKAPARPPEPIPAHTRIMTAAPPPPPPRRPGVPPPPPPPPGRRRFAK